MIWVDAQISPLIADWIESVFHLDCKAVRDVGLRDADDLTIFQEARRNNVMVLTKDRDFVVLLERHGPPPKVIWLTCGNTSNSRLKTILSSSLIEALDFLASGERLVEIR